MASRAAVARRFSTPKLRVAGIRAVSGTAAARRDAVTYATLLGEGWTPPAGPKPATERQAMSLPPFGRGVALVANAIAGTSWHAQRWAADLGVHVRLPDQPSVVVDPAPLGTPWHYKWGVTEDLILYGNSFGINGDIDHRTSRPAWLLPVPADDVWILTDPNRPTWFQWTIAGQTFDPDEITHISAGNRSGEILGRGVLAQYGDWLGGAVAAEDHAAGYFSGGALPPAVLQSPNVVNETQANDLKKKWREMASTREPVVLPTGYVLTQIVSRADQAQLVESRQWGAEMVAAVVGIPTWKLGLPGPTMTYQNVETADIDFVRDCVDRWGRPIIETFTKWLMPRGTELVYDYASRMRADQKTVAEVLAIYRRENILTNDEARRFIGRPPLAALAVEYPAIAGAPDLSGEPAEITDLSPDSAGDLAPSGA